MADKQPINKSPGRPFTKGHSGNPKGRPRRDFVIPDVLRAIGKELVSGDSKATKYEAMCQAAWDAAIAGDKSAREWIADRIEGKPHQTIAQTNEVKAEVRVIE